MAKIISQAIDRDGPSTDQIRTFMREFIRKHGRVAGRHNSNMYIPGETDNFKDARMKWLERGAGMIMFYEWAFNGGPKPDWFDQNFDR